VLIAAGAAAACSGTASESGDTSLVVDVSMMAVTVENQTGTSLVKGEVNLLTQGIPRSYMALLPHMSNGEKRSFPLETFRSTDGTQYRRSVVNARSVKVVATDVGGKTYQREVPFK
jgi:hypothetical protein